MHISENMAAYKTLGAHSNPAVTYEKRDGVYDDYPSPGERWLCIGSGPTHISLRLTRDQLDTLARACEVAVREIDAASAPPPDRDPTQPADAPTVAPESWVGVDEGTGEVLATCQASRYAEAEAVLRCLLPVGTFGVCKASDLEDS